ncbi:MAG: NirA family protein [Verrucomicrobiaceae bacterium]
MISPASPFTEEQTGYLNGFMAGIRQSLPFMGQNASGQFTNNPEEAVEENVWGTPVEDLCREELVKHEQNGLDCYDTILDKAAKGEFASDGDIFRFKFHGLFYVTPAQEAYMLRARIPGCALSARQLHGMAEISEDWGGGYLDVTTRGNLQIREILPANSVNVLNKIIDIGLTSKGSGADNVRNITATPTTGFDKDELIDVMPYAKAMHHAILNNRDLYGMPRKFNISYDSGGAISVCADTNDIAFYAVTLKEDTQDLKAGVYFRVQLCGITGHKQFASDSGLLVTPSESTALASAMLRVFIENGDRTNRKKARLKYLIDDWGTPKFLDEVQKKLAFPLRFVAADLCEKPRPKVKHGHVGTYKQADGNNYLGIVIPVGRMTCDTAHTIADIAEEFGTGDIRLTAWQNLLIPHIPDEKLADAQAAIKAAGLAYASTTISGGLVACTGNTGCKFAAANTKGQAVILGNYLETRVELDQPINIHLTGCHHSCAQHYIGDIGLMGTPVKLPSGEKVEGYNIVLGGGVDDTQAIAREVYKSIPFTDIPPLIESLLQTYLANRTPGETFANYTQRERIEDLVPA